MVSMEWVETGTSHQNIELPPPMTVSPSTPRHAPSQVAEAPDRVSAVIGCSVNLASFPVPRPAFRRRLQYGSLPYCKRRKAWRWNEASVNCLETTFGCMQLNCHSKFWPHSKFMGQTVQEVFLSILVNA